MKNSYKLTRLGFEKQSINILVVPKELSPYDHYSFKYIIGEKEKEIEIGFKDIFLPIS